MRSGLLVLAFAMLLATLPAAAEVHINDDGGYKLTGTDLPFDEVVSQFFFVANSYLETEAEFEEEHGHGGMWTGHFLPSISIESGSPADTLLRSYVKQGVAIEERPWAIEERTNGDAERWAAEARLQARRQDAEIAEVFVSMLVDLTELGADTEPLLDYLDQVTRNQFSMSVYLTENERAAGEHPTAWVYGFEREFLAKVSTGLRQAGVGVDIERFSTRRPN